jgi:hypothetical protein
LESSFGVSPQRELLAAAAPAAASHTHAAKLYSYVWSRVAAVISIQVDSPALLQRPVAICDDPRHDVSAVPD